MDVSSSRFPLWEKTEIADRNYIDLSHDGSYSKRTNVADYRMKIGRPALDEKTTASLTPINFQSMQDRVYDQITAGLMCGNFEPGQKVSSRKLARALGTSEMPVRNALGRLLAEHALMRNGNGTFSIPLISKTRFREVMQLRALLERQAVIQACGHVDTVGFGNLRKCSAGLSLAIRLNRIDDYLDYNQRLKYTIYNYTPSATMRAHIRLLWLQAGPALRFLSRDLQQVRAINFHEEAIAALAAGNAEAAGEAISNDILGGMQFLLATASFAEDDQAAEPPSRADRK